MSKEAPQAVDCVFCSRCFLFMPNDTWVEKMNTMEVGDIAEVKLGMINHCPFCDGVLFRPPVIQGNA